VVKTILKQFGIPEERVWFRFISASEGKLFGETVQQMVDTLKKLGPNPLKTQWEI